METLLIRHIRKRVVTVFCVATFSLLGVVVLLNIGLSDYIKRNSSISSVINVAGQQMMLSENISKTHTYLQLRPGEEKFQDQLDSLIQQFDSSHRLLLAATDTLVIDASRQYKIDSLFSELEEYRAFLSDSRPRDSAAYSFDSLMHNESRFLPIMNKIVGTYEEIGASEIQNINSNVSIYNYFVVGGIFSAASGVLIITLMIIGRYDKAIKSHQNDFLRIKNETHYQLDKLNFLTDSIEIGIWEFNGINHEEKWNKQLYEILGYENNEIKGTYENFMNHVHPSDKGQLIEAGENTMHSGIPSTIEIRVKTKEDQYKWVAATGSIRRNQDGRISLMIGGITDINSRKITENQLKYFIENAPAAIAMFNDKIEYIAASKKWYEDYGISGQEIIGKNHYEIFPEIGDEWKNLHQQCLKGEVIYNDEDPFERLDGSLQWMKWEIRPWFVAEDHVGGILMFTEDITEQKNKQEELRDAKIKAENAAKSKEQFLATMSHEIRTPLNAINGLVQILMSEQYLPSQEEHLHLIRFSANNLLTLVNDILDVAKIESGKLELESRPFDFRYLIENLERSLAYAAKEKLVKLHTEYDDQLPSAFIGDQARITQILYNLAGNAIKFTEEGTVKIKIQFLGRNDNMISMRISVKDSGIGIEKEKQDKIFQAFEQADTSITRRFGGTGLGLFITKQLIEKMGSQIELDSEPGNGSEFSFDLQLKESEVKLSGNDQNLIKRIDFTAQNLKILVAEDNRANQIVIKKFLLESGIELDLAVNGKEASSLIQSKKYDLVFMDLHMPIMDGYTATRSIRSNKDSYFQDVPIVALTADASTDTKRLVIGAGMNDILIKPYKPLELFSIIEKYTNTESVLRDYEAKGSLKQIVNDYAEGDEAFMEEFSKECILSFKEFTEEMHQSISGKDLTRIREAIHKVTPIVGMLQQTTLQTLLNQLKEDWPVEKSDSIIDEIENLINEAIENLTSISV